MVAAHAAQITLERESGEVQRLKEERLVIRECSPAGWEDIYCRLKT